MQILEHFSPIFDFTGRYIFLLPGAGTGKSFTMAQKVILDLLSNENCNYLCVRKYYIDARKSILAQIKDIVWKFKLNKYFKFQGGHTIECKLNNSRAQFIGVNEPFKIKSIAEITNIFIEEADELDEDNFDILDTRCRSINMPYNQIILAFNPPEKTHWIAKRFFKNGNILPEYNKPFYWSEEINNIELKHMALRTHYNGNPYLSEDSKAKYELFKTHNYSYYEKYCVGTWSSNIEGTFFKSDYVRYNSQLGKNIIYFDPAYSQIEGQGDYTCILKTSVINNQYHINSCVLKQNMTPNEILENVAMLIDDNTQGVYYDGHFSQKSFWNFARTNSRLTFPLHEQLIDVDKCIPEVMNEWINHNIVLPNDFDNTQTGSEALKQLYNFAGKKSKSKYHDDFADALICSVHLLNKTIKKNDFLKGWI